MNVTSCKNIDTNKQVKQLAIYLVTVYAMSVPFWIVSILFKNTDLPLNIPIGDIVAAFTPMLAASILTFNKGGRRALGGLLMRLFDYKKITWQVAAKVFGLPIIVYILTYCAFMLLGYKEMMALNLSVFDALALIGFFYFGAIGEEAGYTAYMTDPLLDLYGALRTSIMIGLPWAVWHIPSMLIQGRSLTWIVWGVIGTVAVRYIYVKEYQSAGRCVSAIVVMHVVFNFCRVIFPQENGESLLVAHEAVYYSIIVIVAFLVWALPRVWMAMLSSRHNP